MEDKDAFLGTGWSFPPSFSRCGRDVAVVSGHEDIEQSLAILLATQCNERIMQEGFGCNLDEFLFGEISQGLIGRMRDMIENAILHHEPRVILNEVEISESDAETGVLLISIDYTVSTTNSRFNMVHPFYINETALGGLQT